MIQDRETDVEKEDGKPVEGNESNKSSESKSSERIKSSLTEFQTATEMPYKAYVLIENLEVPWAMDMDPSGRIFFTERAGQVRLFVDGVLQPDPVIRFPDTVSSGEGGLLGLTLHPDFDQNHFIYVYQTYVINGRNVNRVIRLIEENNKAEIDKIIIDDLPGSTNHNGGRIQIGPDQKLYITAGDIYQTELAQQINSLGGSILRLELDGSIPNDNPFPGSPIYSWGHRNPQGLDWHPETRQLFSSEHGQSAHDEINIIYPGENYGWPVIEGDQENDEMLSPWVHSGRATWAPSGLTFITQGPWAGDLLVANLRGQQIIRFSIDSSVNEGKHSLYPELTNTDYLFEKELGRVRDVFEDSDGNVYILTNNRDGRGRPVANDDRILILIPE